jgi:hypothetical protein
LVVSIPKIRLRIVLNFIMSNKGKRELEGRVGSALLTPRT